MTGSPTPPSQTLTGGATGGADGWEAGYRNPHGRTVVDLFPGEWADHYLAGAGGPMRAKSG